MLGNNPGGSSSRFATMSMASASRRTAKDTVNDQRPILDYSSPREEKAQQRSAEDERREKTENYNEATFGERRPFQNAFVRLAMFAAIEVAIVLLLPRGWNRLASWVAVVGFLVWQGKTEGSRGTRSSLTRPWRWW